MEFNKIVKEQPKHSIDILTCPCNKKFISTNFHPPISSLAQYSQPYMLS